TSRWWIDRSGTGDTPCNPVANRPRLCLELPPRKPSWPAVMCDRTHRPDIWMQANRSENPPARLEGQGPSTYGLLRRCAPRNDGGGGVLLAMMGGAHPEAVQVAVTNRSSLPRVCWPSSTAPKPIACWYS